jgi:pimeloyl-ACP methyl ester carboxylesterase
VELCWCKVAVELPGRGSRPADLAAVALDDCVQAVIGSADKTGFERFVLVGHSLGGMTITETAWRFPDRAAVLICIAGVVPAPAESAAIAVTGADMPPLQPQMTKEAVRRSFRQRPDRRSVGVSPVIHWIHAIGDSARIAQ